MRCKMPRREFLKVAGTTALAVSAAALTGCGGGGSAYASTRTAKYFASKGITSTNFYMEGSVTDGSWSGKVLVAKSGKNTRYRRLLSDGNSRTGWNMLVLGDTAYELNDPGQEYQLFEDIAPDSWGEKDIKSQSIDFQYGQGHFVVPADNGDIMGIKETTCVVNGTPYYAERITIASEKFSGGSYREYTIDYCFEGDELVYTVVYGSYITTINQLYPNPDPSLLKLPESYTRVPKGEWLEYDWDF